MTGRSAHHITHKASALVELEWGVTGNAAVLAPRMLEHRAHDLDGGERAGHDTAFAMERNGNGMTG